MIYITARIMKNVDLLGERAQRSRVRRGERAVDVARRRAAAVQRVPARVRRRVPSPPAPRVLSRRAAPSAVWGARACVDARPPAPIHRAQARLHARQVTLPLSLSLFLSHIS